MGSHGPIGKRVDRLIRVFSADLASVLFMDDMWRDVVCSPPDPVPGSYCFLSTTSVGMPGDPVGPDDPGSVAL